MIGLVWKGFGLACAVLVGWVWLIWAVRDWIK